MRSRTSARWEGMWVRSRIKEKGRVRLRAVRYGGQATRPSILEPTAQNYFNIGFNASNVVLASAEFLPLGSIFKYASYSPAASLSLPRLRNTFPSMKCESAWFGLALIAASKVLPASSNLF